MFNVTISSLFFLITITFKRSIIFYNLLNQESEYQG